ncbi:hypothetical protein QEO76_gp37 [Arthrobacter phage Cole]|uniref:Uncharacterized protein n=1 Tax=Arthrobacter phage Cole TaxID=2944951 RepID=A0A9E7E5W1_9CAUD|nr:hypothetical protein QEO76_gp37 [Arthrobacter phage Cole]URC18100.1 hypothetical protein SEA_COLE_63 [Arthrobacter phage Cole]
MEYYIGGRRSGKTIRQQAASTPEDGWAAQHLGLPVAWYDNVARGPGAEFPVSGDQTTVLGRPARIALKALGLELSPWQAHVLGQWMDGKELEERIRTAHGLPLPAARSDDTPRRDTQPPKVP